MPPLQPLTLKELSSRFNKSDLFYFADYQDGFFTFFTDAEPFPQSITFYPSLFARLTNGCTIDDIIAAIDTNKHYGMEILLG